MRRRGCRCIANKLTCWQCVEARKWDARWKAKGYADFEQLYYSLQPLALGARHWQGATAGDGDADWPARLTARREEAYADS
jgi:hypothetical protein